MKNETIISMVRSRLKEMLSQCTEEEHIMFKRMYTPHDLTLSIESSVANIDDNKLDWAFTQVKKTINDRKFANISLSNIESTLTSIISMYINHKPGTLDKIRECKKMVEAMEKNKIETIKTEIAKLSNEERIAIYEGYCKYCGCNNPRCYCECDD